MTQHVWMCEACHITKREATAINQLDCPGPYAPGSGATVERLRHECAASGYHDHDGCSCSDAELLRRAATKLETTAEQRANWRQSAESFGRQEFPTIPVPPDKIVAVLRDIDRLLSALGRKE